MPPTTSSQELLPKTWNVPVPEVTKSEWQGQVWFELRRSHSPAYLCIFLTRLDRNMAAHLVSFSISFKDVIYVVALMGQPIFGIHPFILSTHASMGATELHADWGGTGLVGWVCWAELVLFAHLLCISNWASLSFPELGRSQPKTCCIGHLCQVRKRALVSSYISSDHLYIGGEAFRWTLWNHRNTTRTLSNPDTWKLPWRACFFCWKNHTRLDTRILFVENGFVSVWPPE